jgi:hypothetical protein
LNSNENDARKYQLNKVIGAREFNLGRAFRLNPAELVLKDVDLVAAGLSQQVRRLNPKIKTC